MRSPTPPSSRGPSAPAEWRLLDDSLDGAARNMAVDETLLASVAEIGVPTLRLYGWTRPSLSLGYRRDPARDRLEPRWLERADALGVDVVRRPTGGGAVLHSGDLTYAVVSGCDSSLIPGGLQESYAWIRATLVAALRAAGIAATPACGEQGADLAPLCFQASTGSEIEASGSKLVGSAQRRTRVGFLQHGSIRLQDDSELYRALFGTAPVFNAAGWSYPAPVVLRRAIVAAFEDALGAKLQPGRLSGAEQVQVRQRQQARARDRLCAPPIYSSAALPFADNAR